VSANPPIVVVREAVIPPDPLGQFFQYGSVNILGRRDKQPPRGDELFRPVAPYTHRGTEEPLVRWRISSHVASEDAKYLIVTDGHNGRSGFVVPIESSSGQIAAYHRELSWHPIEDDRIEFVLAN